jgi:hypothetical protein
MATQARTTASAKISRPVTLKHLAATLVEEHNCLRELPKDKSTSLLFANAVITELPHTRLDATAIPPQGWGRVKAEGPASA